MPYCATWEEFAKASERLYLADPMKVRFSMKYRHCDGKLIAKITDNQTFMFQTWHQNSCGEEIVMGNFDRIQMCLLYLTEHAQDLKRIEKLTSQLMRHMASKEK